MAISPATNNIEKKNPKDILRLGTLLFSSGMMLPPKEILMRYLINRYIDYISF